MESIRLQKFFTDCGILSRRAAEKEIKAGNVKVNGITASVGDKIDPYSDKVTYKGKIISLPKEKKFVYVLLNKPVGTVTTSDDEKGRKCVTDLVDVKTRVYPVGRLDMNSDGALILTNDGELTNKLTHPRHEIPKIYEVIVKGEISEETLDKINRSMEIDGYTILPVKTELLRKSKASSTLKMTLFEGRNRQIRKMCEQCGLKVLKLTRTSIGDITLGDLALGEWRYLSDKEIEKLKQVTISKDGKNDA